MRVTEFILQGRQVQHLGVNFRTLQFNVHILVIFIHSLVISLEGRAWQEPEPNHVTGMALAHCILGKFLGAVMVI